MRESDEYQVSALDAFISPRRRRGGLGDLTESKKQERGEFDAITGNDPSDLPSNVIPPAPKIQSGVMPVYAALPANGGRFNFGKIADVNTNTGTLEQTVVFTQQIPAGRMVYVNKFRCNIEQVNGSINFGIPPTPYSVTLLLNGQAEIYNQQIFVQGFDDWYDGYLIAGPGDIIQVAVNGLFANTINSVTFITHLAGDMLLPNELSIPYTGLRQTALPVFDVSKK